MTRRKITAQIAGLKHGDHVCMYYETPEEQLAIVRAYIAVGLKRGERCLYVADDRTIPEIVNALRSEGIDVNRERKRGALDLLTSRDAHLLGGRFDCEAMLKLLNDAVDEALKDGFKGLRAAGEMTWILKDAPGTGGAIEYEALMNEFYPRSPALGLCLYHRARFEAETLREALRTHPRVVVHEHVCSNPYFEPPAMFFKRASPRACFDHQIDQLPVHDAVPPFRLKKG